MDKCGKIHLGICIVGLDNLASFIILAGIFIAPFVGIQVSCSAEDHSAVRDGRFPSDAVG